LRKIEVYPTPNCTLSGKGDVRDTNDFLACEVLPFRDDIQEFWDVDNEWLSCHLQKIGQWVACLMQSVCQLF